MAIPALHRPRSGLRLLMPIVILLVAGGIYYWESQRESIRRRDIEVAAVAFVQEVCADRPPTTFMFADESVCRGAIEAIKPMGSAGGAAAITVRVMQGDVASAGSLQGTATHVAIVTAPDGKSVGLRVRYDEDPQRIVVVGFFVQ